MLNHPFDYKMEASRYRDYSHSIIFEGGKNLSEDVVTAGARGVVGGSNQPGKDDDGDAVINLSADLSKQVINQFGVDCQLCPDQACVNITGYINQVTLRTMRP